MLEHWSIVPVVVLAFLALSLYLGVKAGRGRIHSTADHVVGGRNFGLLLVFFVSVGEIYSSVSFLGQPGWAYEHGLAMLLPVGTFIPLLAFWLGPRIWEAGKRGGLITQAQFFGYAFQSGPLRGLAAVIAITGLIPYIAVQMMGGGYVLSVTTQGRIPFWLGGLLAFGVVAVYVYFGGLRGIGWVAVAKGIFMAAVGTYVVSRVIGHYYGSVPVLFQQLAARSPAHLTLPGAKHFVTYAYWTTSLLNGLAAFYMWPHLFANFFSAETPRLIRRQACFIPIYNILTLLFLLVGLAGVLQVQGIRPDTIMVEMILRIAPLWLVALFCAGALSASMVTGAACSLAAAATLGNDLLQPWLNLPDLGLRRLIQGLIFLVVAAAYVTALIQPATIVYIILTAYGFTAQLFPLTIAAFYSRGINGHGAFAGAGAGFLVVLYFIFGPKPPFDLHPGILGMLVNVPTMIIISAVSRTGRDASRGEVRLETND